MTSPTYLIVKSYPLPSQKRLVHIDAYRLTTPGDAASVGLEDYLNDNDSIVLIEWPERIAQLLPVKTRYFSISLNGEERIIKESHDLKN
jgi:tRNA threonylcarbamoyladenosine biosynthesis protein TsaE